VLVLAVLAGGLVGEPETPVAARPGPPVGRVRAAAPVPARKVEWVEEFT
jgi:hypothetical protein